IAIAGALSRLSALSILLVVPRQIIGPTNFSSMFSHVRLLLSNKSLITIGILMLGSQVAFEQVLAFMPFYLQSALLIDPAIAGLIGSLTLVAAIFGGPARGWLYDKKLGFAKLVVILGIGLLAGMFINAVM